MTLEGGGFGPLPRHRQAPGFEPPGRTQAKTIDLERTHDVETPAMQAQEWMTMPIAVGILVAVAIALTIAWWITRNR